MHVCYCCFSDASTHLRWWGFNVNPCESGKMVEVFFTQMGILFFLSSSPTRPNFKNLTTRGLSNHDTLQKLADFGRVEPFSIKPQTCRAEVFPDTLTVTNREGQILQCWVRYNRFNLFEDLLAFDLYVCHPALQHNMWCSKKAGGRTQGIKVLGHHKPKKLSWCTECDFICGGRKQLF